MHKGLSDGTPEATIANVSYATAPADFRSHQTLFEYDSAGNLTRSITEGLPAGRRAYDRLGNLIYEEDAAGVARTYTYDVLNQLVRSDTVQAKAIPFTNAQVFTLYGDADSGNWAKEAGDTTLYMFGKNRIAVPLNHEITPYTILEFDFEAPSTPFAGEWYDLSFINAIDQHHALTFKLGGTDPRSLGTRLDFNNYVHGSGPKHFRIPIGQQYGTTQLAGSGKYIVFTNFDNIANGPDRGQSRVSNVRIYEAAGSGLEVGTTTNAYDKGGRLTSTTDALGNRTAYVYNSAGRLAKIVFPDSTFAIHEYDDFGNCVATTDELGRTTRYIYDDRNRLIQTIYADGSSTRTRYDGAGQVISMFDERGSETRFTYDKAGRLLTTITAAGLAEQTKSVNKYDSRGRRVESVDANGTVTKYFFDNLDRPVQTTVLDKSHTSPNDTALTPVQTSKPPVHVLTMAYDSNGSVVRTATFDPRMFAASDYAALLGNAASLITATNEVDNKIQVVRTAYDAFGRVAKVTNADGTSTSTIYDADGRLRFTFDELARKTRFDYDKFGRLEKITYPDPDGPGQLQGRHLRYERDSLGRIKIEWEYVGPERSGHPVTHETANWFIYDSRGQLIRRSDKYDAMLTRFVYDPAGQLVSTISPDKSANFSRFDKRGRVVSSRLTDPDGSGPQFAPVTTNKYDPAGNVSATIDPLGNETWFEYDALNRLKKESRYHTLIVDDAEGGESTFVIGAVNSANVVYIGNGNAQNVYGRDVTVLVSAAGTPRSATWTFGSLDAGTYTVSLASLTANSGDPTTIVEILNASMTSVASYTLGQLQSSPMFSTIEGEFRLDWSKLTTPITVTAGGTFSVRVGTLSPTGIIIADAVRIDRVVSSSYTYDRNSNLVSETDTRGYTNSFAYDELGRQVRVASADPDRIVNPLTGTVLSNGSLQPLITDTFYDGYGNVVQTVENRGSAATADDRANSFEYDQRNRLVKKIVDAGAGRLNVTTEYEYDRVGNTTLITDAEGYRTRYRYDDADRRIDEYRDFGEGRENTTTIPLSVSTVGAYGLDGGSIPSLVSFPDVNSIQLSGNAWKKVDINYTLRHNSVLEFEFESSLAANYHLIGFDTDDAFGGEDLPRFFELGGTNSAPDALHAEFRREILQNGKTRVHIPVGQYLSPAEKVSGLVVSRLVLVNWDFRANLHAADRGQSTFSDIRLYDSDEIRTVTTYDTQGNVETIREASDPRNITTLYRYDRLRRLVAERIDYGGAQQRATDYKYENLFHLTSVANYVVGNETRSTTYEYDRLGRRIRTTLPDPDGNTATPNGLVKNFIYDVVGNLIAETNGENETTRWLYDEQGNVISKTDGNGDETRYRYDSEGNLIAVTDAEQNVTRYKYDGLNRVTEETITAAVNGSPQLLYRTYGYKADGNLERSVDRNGRLTLFEYDRLDRKVKESGFVGSTGASGVTKVLSWQYDQLGRVTKQVDSNTLIYVPGTAGTVFEMADDLVDTFAYDGLGRIIEERNYDPATLASQGLSSGVPRVRQTYDYFFKPTATGTTFSDIVGRTQYLVTSGSGTPIVYTESEYDRVGRLANFTDQDAAPSLGPAVERKHLKFSYDALDNLRTIERRGNQNANGVWQNTLTSTLVYDMADRVKSITHGLSTSIVHSYAYDNASRVKQFNTVAGTADLREYTYDDAGQLNARFNAFGTPLESFAYDDNGNRISVGGQTVVTGLGNRVTSDGTYAYTYDGEGNLIRRTPSANVSASNPVIRYAYDHRNRLTTVTSYTSTAHADAGTNSIQVIAYTYDAQGRRVKRAFDANGGTPNFVNETFVYEGNALAMRFGNAGELTHRYLHGPTSETLVDEVFNASGQSIDTLWLLGDHQGAPRDIVDDNGVLRKHTNYDSFGRVIDEQFYARNGSAIGSTHAEAVEQLFGYTGQERDQTTGLQLHGERWYDPRTGRWLSEDPLGFDGGDANLYRYVGNSPLNYTDPTGTTQAGNPYTNLNIYNGGYSGGAVAANKPVSTYVASSGSGLSGGTFGTIVGTNPYAPVSSAFAAAAPSHANNFGLGFGSLSNEIATSYFGPTREQILDAQLNPHGAVTKVQTINPTIYGDKFRRPAAALDTIAKTSNNPLAAGTAQFIKPVATIAGEIAGGFIDTIFPPSDPTRIVTYADGTRNLHIGEGPSTGSFAEFGLLATGGNPRNVARPASTLTPKASNNTPLTVLNPKFEPNGRTIVKTVAQEQADKGIDALRTIMSQAERRAFDASTAAGSRFLGTAVHKATAEALRDVYNGRFVYNKVGPDFLDTATRQLIELTTPGQVASHVAKGGAYVAAKYATYILPK